MWPRLRRWWRVVWAIANATRRRAAGHDLMLIAAGLTLYAGIAIVPLLLLGLYGAGLMLDPATVTRIVRDVAEFVPANLGVRDTVLALGDVGPRLGIPSLVASIVAATTYGEGMLRAIDALEGEQRPNRTVMGRLRVLPYVGVFPIITVAGLATEALLPGMLGGGTRGQLLGVYATFWIGWLSASALLFVLYRLFAVADLRRAAVVWGSVAIGSFLTGMSLGWVLVLRFGVEVGRAFGGSDAVGRVVLFAVYLLLVQVAVLVGYLLVLSINDHLTGAAGSHQDGPAPIPTTTRRNHHDE